ncbi:glutamine amidotransferase [Actinoplanes sp. SE50]|uniref:class II glutamine amidotransferase n=1 Tax=unclassified Actinoplanes TaxID=2626549 RepID=UPI00023ECEB8|nr:MULTISPECIES: class II glutamine amidotransferase [unclassified Actinoplanes]AEV84888.1 Glucosamine-fructose-6-phosphate aminotransferase [Actinoplanes sp. SE50/110]ATO83279.1 glutamine amidotransferase [Actinoplanes sp. SE50]SLM00686.1 class II glutamine amidotransferase [Actinoplanes sp. SE50/110]
MCRWLAYSGTPIRLEELLYKPRFSLIDQSRHARLGVETTNGDGFGVGWYPVDGPAEPALLRGVGPAWSDANLREVAGSTTSPLFLAHIRASTGTAVQQTNCHPFRHENWLWAHNGSIREFGRLKRDLVLAVDPRLYPALAGSTDSEVMFHLALTFGLRDRPVAAVERMAGLVEAVGRAHGVDDPLQMTVATTDGDRFWCFRYSSEGHSRSLFYSTAMTALQQLHPEVKALRGLSGETRLVVSEPLGELTGAWQEVPEASYGVIQKGADELGRFEPAAP